MASQNVRARLLGTSASVLFLAGMAQSAMAQTAVGGDTGSVETIVVTGTRLQAQEVKQDAPNVLDIRPVDEIQKLPDVNLAEALQRVPGVSLETDSGEGRFINIRGMDADLNGTTFDGVRLTASNASSPQGGARAVAFDAFPSGLFGGVEVIKSLTPDIDAEGLGGVVNLLPRTMPEGRETLLDASLGSGVETLRGSPVWDGQVTVGGRFGPRNSITAIISYTYHEDHRGIDDIENSGPSSPFTGYADPDLEYRWYEYHRIRQGLGGSLSWDVDSSTTLYARAFDAGYTEYANKHRLEIDNLNVESDNSVPVAGANGSFTIDDAAAKQVYTDSKETIQNKLAEFGGHTVFGGDIAADFRASWTEGDDVVPWSYGFTFNGPQDFTLTYNDTSDPNHPTFDASPLNLADPSIYTKGKLKVDGSDNQDQEVGGVVNFSVPLPIDDHDGDLKFGASVRARIKRAIATEAGSATVGGLSNYIGSADQIYYDGLYNIGPMANLAALAAVPESAQVVDPSTYEHDNENIYAEYIQYTTTIGKLGLLGGVRVETTNATYNANLVDGNDNLIGPSVNKQDYTNVFPDLNAKYQVTDEFLVRGAFTTSLARPGFNQITAAKTYDYDNDIISQGNPSLKATTADNIDLTAEYYLPKGGIASGGLFYKSFSNYIIPTTNNDYPVTNPPFSGTTAQFNSFANIGSASVKGVELNYQQQFVFLPDMWSGFGFDGNVTYNDSEGDIRPGETHTLPQTSPWNYNAALYYEKYGLDLRLGASFVSKNLWAVGSDATQDLYSQPRFRLDFGGSYAITENIEWYVDVKNITNTKLEFTQTPSTAYPVQRELYDADYLFGIRAHF